MPNDPNYTDDDNLIPDWMRDMAPEPSPDESEDDFLGDVPSFAAQPPWDQLRGEPPSGPAPLSPAAPPWELFEAEEAPPPAATQAAAPWEVLPGPEIGGPGVSAWETEAPPPSSLADRAFEWESAPDQPSAEIPYGLTAQLPWRSAEQPEPEPEEQPRIEPSSGKPGGAPDEPYTMAGLRDEFDQGGPSEPEPPSKSPSLADRLRALSPKRETPPSEPLSEEEADWMSSFGQAADYDATAPSDEAGDLDWLGEEEPAPEPEAERPQAETALPLEPEAEEELPWLTDEDLGTLPLLDEEPSPAAPAEEVPGWLATGYDEESAPAEPEEPAQAEGQALPDWLSQPGEPPPAERPRTGIRRLVPRKPPQEEATREAAPSPQTYEEWERSQIEREREAQKTDEDRLLEEVPDWFEKIDTGKPAAPETPGEPAPPEGPEFRPDWYAGLEEQPAGEVPDWFEKLDYSADALAQPFSGPATPEPAPEEPEVPDWFKGAETPELAGLDWAAAFGAPTSLPSEEQVEASEPSYRLEPAGPEEELPLPDLEELADFEEAEAEEGEVPDWMASAAPQVPGGPEDEGLVLRDLEALGGAEEEITPGEAPEWIAAAPPDSGVIAGPDEIQFPELDLDQAMPSEAAYDYAAPGARPKQPAQPDDDFVERFEPLEPDEFRDLPAALDEEAPDWLREIADDERASSTPMAERPGALPSAQAAEELDWLTELSPEDVPQETSAPEAARGPRAQPEEADLFDESSLDSQAIDQLLSLYEPETPEPEVEEAPLEAVDLEPPLEEEEVSEAPPEEEGMPYEVTGAPDPEAAAAADEMARLRALLSEAKPGEGRADLESLFDQSELEGVPGEEEVGGQPEQGRRAPETPPRFSEQGPTPEELMAEGPHPEWIDEMRPSDLPVTVKAGGAETSVKQKQVIELPERLRAFRESALHELRTEEPTPPEASGPLAGIAGALPAADVMLPHETVKPVEGLVITEEQHKRVQKLQALLDLVAAEEEEAETARAEFEEAERFALEGLEPGIEAVPAPPAKRPRRARRFKADRLVIGLLLLVALIAPFATDALYFAADPPALTGERKAVADTVDTLAAGKYVLVALEYSPTAAGELDPLAEAVLRDVLSKGAIPLALSTNPAGAFHAEAVFAPLVDDQKLLAARGTGETALTPGKDYTILSYLPGEAVGVRSLRGTSTDSAGNPQTLPAFKTDLRGDQTGLSITSLEQDIALIVVVGDESGAVRMWAEQLQGVHVPKVALVTAAIEPLTTPYVNPDAYVGYLAGVRDTYSYNAARNTGTREPYQMPGDLPVKLPDPEDSRWHSMALGLAMAAGLVALGLVLNLFRALTRRGRS
jgi:hypothetical protein